MKCTFIERPIIHINKFRREINRNIFDTKFILHSQTPN